MLSDYFARQFSKPRGLVGRWLIAPYLNRINAAGNQLVFDTMSAAENESILEIGFGGGDLLVRVARAVNPVSVTGIEISMDALATVQRRRSRENLDLHLVVGAVEQLPFNQRSFDLVYSVNTIYFWPDIHRGLAEIFQVLSPGGRIALGFGCRDALKRKGYDKRGFKLFSSDEIIKCGEDAGFSCHQVSSIERGARGPFYVYRGYREQ